MDSQSNTPNYQAGASQQTLPNATLVLVLGIVSIVGCFCFGGVGLISGIIALVIANKDMALYRNNPGMYTEASYKNVNTGRICAIIGLSLSIITTISAIVMLIKFGAGVFTDPSIMNNY